MRNLLFLLAAAALFFVVLPAAAPVSAAPMFDDPQLCLNGKLLVVAPTTAMIDVFVGVGPDITVDYVVTNCGGVSNLPVVDPSQVTVGGKKNQVQVRVHTAPKTIVLISFDGKTKSFKSDKWGWVEVQGKVK